MPARRKWLLTLGTLAVVLLVVGIVWGVGRFEADLEPQVTEALATGEFGPVTVQVDGRDVTVRGALMNDEAAIEELLGGIDGVREVRFAERVTPAPPTTALPPPTTAVPTTVPPAPGATTTSVPPPPTTTTVPEGATLTATLEGGQFSITGVVPDEQTAAALLTAATTAYAPFVTSDITVSPLVEPEPWLAGAPFGVTLLPMISEGTIHVSGNQIELTGKSPNPQYLGLFEQAVGATFGITDISTDVEITNLAAPRFNARQQNELLVLSGELPSEEIRQIIVGGAVAAYGPDAVDDRLTVADGLYTSFWMYTMPVVFQLFAPFPDYEINVEEGVTSGALHNGANFAFGSAELDDNLRSILDIGIALMVRDQSLGMLVEGHTDSVGSAAFNQRLSEARAQAAIDYFVAGGVDPARMRRVGLGETDPIATNDTDEGRAANRRVEFVFGPVAEVVAGG